MKNYIFIIFFDINLKIYKNFLFKKYSTSPLTKTGIPVNPFLNNSIASLIVDFSVKEGNSGSFKSSKDFPFKGWFFS